MLLILVAGGSIAAAATRWIREHPGRIEEEFKTICREAYLELHETRAQAPERGAKPIPPALEALDLRYQQFVVNKVDPLLSRTRRDQLAELTSGGAVTLTEHEGSLNRNIGAALIAMGSATISTAHPAALVVTIGASLFCCIKLFRKAYHSLVHERKLGIRALGTLYLVGAFVGGFFLPATFGIFVWFLTEKLVLITQDRSQHSLISAFGEQPQTVWLLADNKAEVEVPIERVQSGDTVVVQAGQVVPVDGVIVSGIATIDQHRLTGESQPVEKAKGDSVLTSTLMVGGKVHVCVERTGEETVVAQIGTMLRETASYQASIVSKGEQVADRSVPPTLLLAAIAYPISGYRFAVAVLGSSIGLNIMLTAPISMLNFLNVAAKNGILVKDGRSLELLNDVDLVVFDKTGTLTMDQPQIANIHTCAGLDDGEVLVYAAAAEQRQTHPIARALLQSAQERGLTLPPLDIAHYELGFGIRVRLDGRLIRVGSLRYMELEDIQVPSDIQDVVQAVRGGGNALVMVAVDEELVGAIELQPTLRTEVFEVVRALRSRNLELCIISGDQEEPTRRMADELGITRFFANTLPEEKASLVADLQREGHAVCFVGDGINDSISLKKANVSVSLRGASTAATDSAQVVLMGQGLHQLPFLFQLSDEFNSNMKAGFDVAIGQGIVVIGGALLGIVGIVPGALIWTIGLAAGVGIAHLPLWRHRAVSQRSAAGPPPIAQPALGAGSDADALLPVPRTGNGPRPPGTSSRTNGRDALAPVAQLPPVGSSRVGGVPPDSNRS